MSKLTQIEAELRKIDQAEFQRLCDAYLYRRGYERINPIGLVIGFDKVAKGTPDTLVPLPNGKYVFAEYTTQQSRVFEKFQDDLGKCLDEAKMGVSVAKIQEIVLCHNSVLEPKEEDVLIEQGRKQGCIVTIFGIGPMSHDLYQKFPGLARDFLGVQVDTGQIVAPQEFVNTYDKSTFTTPLNTAFHFRDDEIEQILAGLNAVDLIVVSGRAGVGKTRIALECCTRFVEEHSGFEVHCIFNRGPDLFEDLRVHFSPSGAYLILVDDANRVNRFEYVLQLLHERNEDRKIKIIATVRDYALDRVREAARPYGDATEVELQPLTDDQISHLVSSEMGIQNPLYLDRITGIAKGNPRLAIMAARVAVRENTLQSIYDVSVLYDQYFSSIRHDLHELGDKNHLKVAGIVAFFRVVDRSNDEMMTLIASAFNIAPESFWEGAQRLHELEVLDMYENEVVRASDQVLATYLFYLTFFKEKVLSFSTLLEQFFPAFRYRVIDALNALFTVYDGKVLSDMIRPHVDQAWNVMEQTAAEESLLHLLDVFWFLKETDTLVYIHEKIVALQSEQVEVGALQFKPDSSVRSPSVLHVLSLFSHGNEVTVRMALSLLLDYLEKRPSELPKVLHILIEDFGYKHTSYIRGFAVQRFVIDVLGERAGEGKHFLCSKVFLAIANQHVQTRFHTHEPKGKHTIAIFDFELPPTPELFELRRIIWQHLFSLYHEPRLRQDVLGVLGNYCQSLYQAVDQQIFVQDAAEILPFISSQLDPDAFNHCRLVQSYLRLLRKQGIPFDDALSTRFTNDLYNLSQVLLNDYEEQIDLGWEAYQEQRQERIKVHFANYQLPDYERFFEQCTQLYSAITTDQEKAQFQSTVIAALLTLANANENLYIEVLEHYLKKGNLLDLDHSGLITELVEACDIERSYDLLVGPDYHLKNRWLFGFFIVLPSTEASPERLARLYDLYGEASLGDLPYNMDYLTKYLPVDSNVFVRVTEILTEKSEQDQRYGLFLTGLFNPYNEISKKLPDLFAHDVALLKRAYFAAHSMEEHADYEGAAFDILLDLDPSFAQEYVEWMYSNNEQLSRSDDTRNYEFLWKRDDYEVVMKGVVERIYELERGRFFVWNGYMGVFFTRRGDRAIDPQIEDRQNRFLKQLIESRYADVEFMVFVFDVIAKFAGERRKRFIGVFLDRNKRFEDFTELSLEPGAWSWSGSMVPTLQSRVDFLESLIPLFDSVDLLQHRQRVERLIQGLRKEIEHQKKRDFMED